MRKSKTWQEWSQLYQEAQARFDEAHDANDDDRLLVWSLRLIALEDERLSSGVLNSKLRSKELVSVRLIGNKVEMELNQSEVRYLSSRQRTDAFNCLMDASRMIERADPDNKPAYE